MHRPLSFRSVALSLMLLLTAGPLLAADLPSIQSLQAKLTERLPDFPKLDEVRATELPGVYELRAGQTIYYGDAQGNFILRGDLIDTKRARNLTQQRIEQLSAIAFAELPLKDALVWKTGTGKRRLAVFADPNCPYCRKLEGELQNLKDATVYLFLYPALGDDSAQKAQNILCGKEPQQVWRNWMLKGVAVPAAPACATAVARNTAFARDHRINGVPTLFFEDGSRAGGYVSLAQIEAKLEGDKAAVKPAP
jgi:thiol:disulfide interchange protein DsbC